MNKCIYISLLLSLGLFNGCSKPKPQINDAVENSNIQPTNKESIHLKQATLTPESARNFGKELYKKIEHDEPLINSAFKLKDQNLLNKYQDDFKKFTDTPFSETEAKQSMGQKYFPTDPAATPYALCDRALNGLYSQLSSMQSLIQENSEYMRSSLKEKQKSYKQFKHECKLIVEMNYDKAAIEYEKYI